MGLGSVFFLVGGVLARVVVLWRRLGQAFEFVCIEWTSGCCNFFCIQSWDWLLGTGSGGGD